MTPQRRKRIAIACAVSLVALAAAVVLPGLFTSTRSSAESSAVNTLKSVWTAQRDFRDNDFDGNKIHDYWVGDIDGLVSLKGPDGKPLNLLNESYAKADVAPLNPRPPEHRMGYFLAVIPHRADGTPFDQGNHRNPDEFALCAFPVKEGDQVGKWIFIVDHHGRVLRTPIKHGEGRRILRWPSDEDIRQNWQKVD
jgi:hypothetical protein